MATFGELQTKVSQRLLDSDNTAVSASEVADAINDSIVYWKVREFDFNSEYASLTMTQSDGTLPLPSDFLVPNEDDGGFQIEYSSQRFILGKISAKHYNSIWRGNGDGRPQFYARVGQSYEAYPIPDRDYTVNISYLKDYPDLVDDADTNDFTVKAPRLIILWSCANLIAERRQDDKMEAYFRAAAEDQFRQLGVLRDKADGSGSLTVY